MSRLIDVDNLKFPNIAIFDMRLHGTTVPMVRLVDLQELIPTIDAVPVVRCKDCKWWNNYSCQNDVVLYQIDDCGCHPTFYVNPDWFCPEAERKEEQENE